MIRLKNVCKTYSKNKKNAFTALQDIDLTIEDGEFVAIIGKSGAGKSTLMHIIGCIDDFDGEYELNGQEISHTGGQKKAQLRNSQVGIVLQDFALVEEYTVEENVMIPLYFSRDSKKKKAFRNKTEQVKKVLQLVGIDDLSRKKVNELSGGQKQRVAIARALVNEPEILLADEPTGALDSKTGKEIVGVFSKINQSGKTVILITHDKEVAAQAKRVIEIKDGKML